MLKDQKTTVFKANGALGTFPDTPVSYMANGPDGKLTSQQVKVV